MGSKVSGTRRPTGLDEFQSVPSDLPQPLQRWDVPLTHLRDHRSLLSMHIHT